MNCVLFAKMDQVLSLKNKTFKAYWKMEKMEKLGTFSVRKSGNYVLVIHMIFTESIIFTSDSM